MSPRQVVETWVEAFNRADVEALAAMYAEDANPIVSLLAEAAKPNASTLNVIGESSFTLILAE